MIHRYLTFLILLLSVLGARAAEQSPAEVKLRESLRNTMLQLRNAQGERETLEAEKTQLAQEKQALAGQLEALTKESTAAQEVAGHRLTALESKTSSQELEIARLSEALAKWKTSQQEATTLAANKESARAKLAQRIIELQRQVADQQTRNLAMYKTGSEILARYEGFGLGTALTAREPFVGTTRVKLENLVQDYADKLTEQRIAPESPAPAKPASSPAAKAPTARAGQTNSPTAGPRNIGTRPLGESGQPATTHP